MKKVKVLHVLGGFNFGGAETFIINLYRNIDREKFQFDALIRDINNPQAIEFEALGGEVYKTAPFPKMFIRNWIETKKFFKHHAWQYDVIHIHANALVYVLPILWAKKYNCKKIILHSHNTQTKSNQIIHQINKIWLKYVNVCLACGTEAGKWMFDERPFTVIHNGINLSKYQYNLQIAEQKREEIGFLKDDFIIGHVGRFAKQKNHKFLIEIFEEILKEEKKAKLLLIGNGELKENIENLIKEKGIQKSVCILSNRKDVPKLLQAMDIFVFPSLYEGLSIALIEAQATGLPCVISDTIDRKSAICENVEAASLDDSITKWVSTIMRYRSQKNIREKAIEIIKNEGYSIDCTVESLEKIYIE